MARNSKRYKQRIAAQSQNQTQPVRDLTWWYSDLAFVPEDWKESRVWAAQALFHAKLNSVQLIDSRKAAKYRKLGRMEIDRQEYVNLIDPPTPGGGGGTAEYFAADFKDLPTIHINNIIRAKLDKIGVINKLQVNEIDKFAKSQRQKDRDKIIYQREFRNLINEVNQEIGLPPITEAESPYDYVKRLQGDSEEQGSMVDNLERLIENIRMQIKDGQDLQLYEQYVYKGDIERCIELWLEQCIINENKWRIVSEYFIEDLINFNRTAGRFYPDNTTGRGVIEYLDGTRVFTSPFHSRDGDDILYWFYEKDITFGDFVRQFGTTLTDEELKEVFMLNKLNGASHLQDWGQDGIESNATIRRNSCLIRIGYASFLTQEAQSFSEAYVDNRTPVWMPADLTWKPDEDSAEQKQKIYNVWHSFYYIPPPGDRLNKNVQANWAWQSKYIFNLQKDTDMYRYGADRRFAKSQLVIYRDDRPSVTDVKEAFMPKIRTLWHKFQNSIVQDANGVIFDEDLLAGIFNAVDEQNETTLNNGQKPSGGTGVQAGMQAWRMLRQGGVSFMKFKDKNGQLPPNFNSNNLMLKVDTGHLDKAEKYLQIILQQYELMRLSLAQSDVSEGQAPKPRTAVAGIQASIEASNNAIWFIEKPVREFLIMYGERATQNLIYMIKEKRDYGEDRRWENVVNVLGKTNAMMLEGLADLDMEDIGLNISLEDTSAMADKIEAMAMELAANNKIAWAAVGLVVDQAKINYKYAYALLMLSVKEYERRAMEMEELAHQRQLELGNQQLQVAQALQGVKTQGKVAEIEAEGQMQAMLAQQLNDMKYKSQSALKDQTTQNRIIEKNATEEKKAELENTKPLI